MKIIKIINKSNNPPPSYATVGSAGMDLHACLDKDVRLFAEGVATISTGLYIELPEGYEGQIRSRSGLASKQIVVLNSPATIDSDYRGEIKVLLKNHSVSDFTITNGMKIAQLVICSYERIHWENAETLQPTVRGDQGFGSTGV